MPDLEINGDASKSHEASPVTRVAGVDTLVRTGPAYRFQKAFRLIENGNWHVKRRIVFALAVGWLPLVVITLVTHPRALAGLLTDYPVNGRMLFSVPVLIVGQILMENTFRQTRMHINSSGVLQPSELHRLDNIGSKLVRIAESPLVEILIVLVVYGHVFEMMPTHILLARPWAASAGRLTVAGWYYAVISQLLYQFMLFLSLWKWMLWSVFLFRLSRLNMQLQPTHPDLHGGIGFLGLSPLALVPTILVAGTAIGGTWRSDILRRGIALTSFKADAITLLVLTLMIAFGPLSFFVPKLVKLRRRGILEYGTLAQTQCVHFHQKWVANRDGNADQFVAAPDQSALIDFASTYQRIESLQPFPIDRSAFVGVLLATALPIVPVVLTKFPLLEILKGLLLAVR